MGVRELLSRDDPPTGIVAINDMYALGAYAGARDLGFRVPDDISIVGFDDIVLAEIAQPALTTIRQPVPAMTEMLVRMLVAHVEGSVQADEPAFIDVTPQLIVRGSTTAAQILQPA
jgi:DNA-binding LacI/PurR family transcriptional regulator